MVRLLPTLFVFICFYSISFSQVFEYDELNRLTNIQYANSSSIIYSYDQLGNRTSTTIVLGPSVSRSNLKVFLEGCYSSGQMLTLLNSNGYLPKDQPFNSTPWNYRGTESVTIIPSNIVDWVLIEIRTGLLENTKVATRTAFLKSDGSIVDLDGTSQVSFNTIEAGNYYVVVRHRNHLDIMSSSPVTISSSSSTLYDFTTAQTQAYGNNPMKDLGSGVFGMYSGDASKDGQIDADDRAATWNERNQVGYLDQDVTMDGQVDADDRATTWNNRNVVSQVPTNSLLKLIKKLKLYEKLLDTKRIEQ